MSLPAIEIGREYTVWRVERFHDDNADMLDVTLKDHEGKFPVLRMEATRAPAVNSVITLAWTALQ